MLRTFIKSAFQIVISNKFKSLSYSIFKNALLIPILYSKYTKDY